MMTINDFKTAEEQIEYLKGIVETTENIIRGLREDHNSGYLNHKTFEEMISLEKASTYNLIEEFLSGEATRTEYVTLVKKWYHTHTGDYDYIWVEYTGFRYLDKREAEKEVKMLNESGEEAMLKEVTVYV